jgi:general secretion pathway protein J
MSARRQKGFTLAEVLIALLIFALIAAASVFALRLGVDSRDQLAATDEALKRIQIARTLMKEDLAQVVPRSVRDEFGVRTGGAFSGGQVRFGRTASDDEKTLVTFTRGGWLNPDAVSPRSALQHVEYILRDGVLIRRAFVYLDETENSDTVERILFENLEDAEAEFLIGEIRGELEWADAWPLSSGTSVPPRAVAIILYEEGKEPLRQLFWIGDVGEAAS